MYKFWCLLYVDFVCLFRTQAQSKNDKKVNLVVESNVDFQTFNPCAQRQTYQQWKSRPGQMANRAYDGRGFYMEMLLNNDIVKRCEQKSNLDTFKIDKSFKWVLNIRSDVATEDMKVIAKDDVTDKLDFDGMLLFGFPHLFKCTYRNIIRLTFISISFIR